MKKILALLLAALMLLSFAACGAPTEAPAEPEAEPPAEAAVEAPVEPAPEATPEPTPAPTPVPLELIDGDYLAFSGDSHGELSVLSNWIDLTKAQLGEQLKFLGYSGDICNKAWEADVFTEFDALMQAALPDVHTVTTGNQEWYDGAPGPDWDNLGEAYTLCGETLRTDDYAVYNFGACDDVMRFEPADIDALSAYLDSVPADLPVFILSHYSLHNFVKSDIAGGGYRCCTNSLDVINVLNEHPNVVFLWGHNHSFADPRYGTIRFPGEQITYDNANPTATTTINFTYASYGIFCRGSRYGLIAGIDRLEDGSSYIELDFLYDGILATGYDSASYTLTADGPTDIELIKGSLISEENILLYSGYPENPDFQSAYTE